MCQRIRSEETYGLETIDHTQLVPVCRRLVNAVLLETPGFAVDEASQSGGIFPS